MWRICLVLLFISSIVLANPILDFVERVAGCKDFVTKLRLNARVFQGANEYNFSLFVDLAVRNQEDFFLEIKEPSELAGLKFWYYGRTKRLYFESLGYVSMENIELPVSTFVSLFELLFKILQTPLTSLNIEKDTVTVKPAPALTAQAKEPLLIKLIFQDGLVKQIVLTSNNPEEFVRLTFEDLRLDVNVDSFFINR